MIKRVFSIGLFLLCFGVTQARESARSFTGNNLYQDALESASNLSLSKTSNFSYYKPGSSTSRSQGPGVIYFSGCGAYNLGVAMTDVKIGNYTAKGMGLEYHIELGLHLHYGIMSDSRITSLSIQLAYMHFNARDTYSDSANVSHKNNFKGSYVGLPIAYSGIFGANGTLGFYFQLGINPQLLLKAKDDKTEVTSMMKPIALLPFASLGLAIPSETGRGALNKVRLLGPYVSTNIGDLSNDNTFSFKRMNIGLRYVTLLTQ